MSNKSTITHDDKFHLYEVLTLDDENPSHIHI